MLRTNYISGLLYFQFVPPVTDGRIPAKKAAENSALTDNEINGETLVYEIYANREKPPQQRPADNIEFSARSLMSLA
jgi:hypothetical protein